MILNFTCSLVLLWYPVSPKLHQCMQKPILHEYTATHNLDTYRYWRNVNSLNTSEFSSVNRLLYRPLLSRAIASNIVIDGSCSMYGTVYSRSLPIYDIHRHMHNILHILAMSLSMWYNDSQTITRIRNLQLLHRCQFTKQPWIQCSQLVVVQVPVINSTNTLSKLLKYRYHTS